MDDFKGYKFEFWKTEINQQNEEIRKKALDLNDADECYFSYFGHCGWRRYRIIKDTDGYWPLDIEFITLALDKAFECGKEARSNEIKKLLRI